MRNIYGKKGQLQGLSPMIIALVLAAVILVMGLIMTQTLQDTIDSVATGVTNDSFNAMTYETNLTAGEATLCDFSNFAVTAAYNLSNGAVINSSCYLAGVNDGNLIAVLCGATTGYNNTHWNVTTTYDWGDEACNAANATTAGLGTFADFWEIIVLAIVVAVVLGLVMLSFGRKGR